MSETTRRTTKRNGDAAPAANRRRSAASDGATVPVAEAKNGSRTEPNGGRRGMPRPTTAAEGPIADREERIRMTAYFLAEQDGFRGEPESYWLAAERAVEESTTR